MQNLVSIIIPYYNRPKKLERCLNSIGSQTYTHFEIIVIDDCSNIPFTVRHNHVKYLKNSTNSGPGVSRNLGMQNATGEFIAFLDCDDYWHPDFLEVLVGELQSNSKAVMAYALGFNVDEHETIISNHRNPKKKDRNCILPNILFSGRAWGTGACLWRTNLIKDTPWISTRCWEDYAFDTAVGVKHNNIILVNQRLVYFDTSSDHKLSNQDARFAAIEKSKSILDISNTLIKSSFANDSVVRRSMAVFFLLIMMRLKKYKVYNVSLLLNIIKSLNNWKSNRFSFYVLILYLLPTRFFLKYMNRLRSRIDQDRIKFLGK